jgi:hypothetical protein
VMTKQRLVQRGTVFEHEAPDESFDEAKKVKRNFQTLEATTCRWW